MCDYRDTGCIVFNQYYIDADDPEPQLIKMTDKDIDMLLEE